MKYIVKLIEHGRTTYLMEPTPLPGFGLCPTQTPSIDCAHRFTSVSTARKATNAFVAHAQIDAIGVQYVKVEE